MILSRIFKLKYFRKKIWLKNCKNVFKQMKIKCCFKIKLQFLNNTRKIAKELKYVRLLAIAG